MGIDITKLTIEQLETLSENLEMSKRLESLHDKKEVLKNRINDVEHEIMRRKRRGK